MEALKNIQYCIGPSIILCHDNTRIEIHLKDKYDSPEKYFKHMERYAEKYNKVIDCVYTKFEGIVCKINLNIDCELDVIQLSPSIN